MAPPIYKSATPALNEKLQQYRDDPQALADLHKRVRQHQKERASQTASGRVPSAPPSPSATHRAASSPHTAPGTHKTARNFIEENAALVSPWPCTGPLSSKAVAAAQQQPPPWEDMDRLGSGDGPDLIASPTSPTRPGSAATPARPGSATAAAAGALPGAAAGSKRYPALTLNLASLGACNSSLQHQQQKVTTPGRSNSSTSSPSPQATASPASRHSLGSATAHSMSRCNSCSMSRIAGQGASNALDCGAATAAGSCMELLATQMAAKKEAAAARAVGAAERRAALAAEQQQRMDALTSRGQRREAERTATQQVEADQSVMLLRQQAWLGVVAATSMAGQLAAALQQQQQRGAAARFIAAAYKSCCLRRRQRELTQLVMRLRRVLKPYLATQRAAAHGRCAERLLSFLQCSTSASMVVCAAQRFRHNVTIIQSFWRQVRLVRAAQEALLMQAMKQLEQRLVLHNRAAAAGRGGSSAGSRANYSSSSGTRQLRVAGDGDVGSRSRVDRSTSRADHSSSNHEAAASAAEPIMRGGGPLIRPHEFFLDESPSPVAAGHSSSSGGPGLVPSAAAAALPHGPMPARGVQMTGQLTMRPSSAAGSSMINSRSSSNLAAEDLGDSSSSSQAEPAVRSVTVSDKVYGPSSANKRSSSFRNRSQSAAPQAANKTSSSSSSRGRSSSVSPVKLGSHRPASARPTSARPASAHVAAGAAGSRGAAGVGPAGTAAAAAAAGTRGAGGGGGAGASATTATGSSAAFGVVWLADAVVDLEVEARLKDLMDVLPNDVRRKVVRAHLSAARRQLVVSREAYASALAHYKARLHLEQVRQQLLKEAGVDVAISLQPPQAPRMRVLPPKSHLKVLIVQGMDLLLQQLVAARTATDDAAKARAAGLERAGSSGSGAKCNN